MNFQQLRIIRETVRNSFNLTEAANALFTSQSGVSKHIRDLEEELGIEIFVRRGKRLLGLTEPGKEVAGIVNRMLVEADNLSRVASDFSKSGQGTLTLATTHTQARYTLPPIIAKFKAAYPEVRLNLQQASPKDLPRILLDENVDVAIATDTLDRHEGILSFAYKTWEHIVVVPKQHPLSTVREITLDTLADWPIITYDEGLTGRSRIDNAFEAAGLNADIAITALDADVIKAYVGLGLGVGIIASIAFDPETDVGLSALRTKGLFVDNTSSIAIRRGRHLRSYVYRFIEFCDPDITEALIKGDGQNADIDSYEI